MSAQDSLTKDLRLAEVRPGPYGKRFVVVNQLGGLYEYADTKKKAEAIAVKINKRLGLKEMSNEQQAPLPAETVATSDPADLIIEVRELRARITELTQQASLHSDQCATFEARIVELQEELRVVTIGRDSLAQTVNAYMEREERAYVEPPSAQWLPTNHDVWVRAGCVKTEDVRFTMQALRDLISERTSGETGKAQLQPGATCSSLCDPDGPCMLTEDGKCKAQADKRAATP